jgi:pimeloyl-ACP methyl ester carboxylesterase
MEGEGTMAERSDWVEHDGNRLAYAHLPGNGPTLVFLPGFASDMQGGKALFLRDSCVRRGQAMLRLDYAGHGSSEGRFESGTISRWTADARAVIEAVAPSGDLILAGSSMGGWIMLLLLRAMGHRVTGVLGIAAAPDFTEDLIWPQLSAADRSALAKNGAVSLPNPYGPPTLLTRDLFDDGADHLVLRGAIDFNGKVRLIHGQSDAEVPWQTSLRIAERISSPDTRVLLIKDGEHRLSRTEDLAAIERLLLELVGGPLSVALHRASS